MPDLETAHRWYPATDPVHGFDHVVRVYHLAERLALAEGADIEIVRAAVLLHDADPDQVPASSQAAESRPQHHLHSADFARQVLEQEGWTDERIRAVQHCIRAHRFRTPSEQPGTLEAQVLFDADKLDAIGAVGVARSVAYAAVRGMPAYIQPSEQFLSSGTKEPGELHSAYHEYIFKLQKLRERLYTASGRAISTERHRFMVEFFIQLHLETEGKA